MDGGGDEENVSCQVGTVQGEDYTFRFGGKIVDGKLHFRLHMEYEGDDDEVTVHPHCMLWCCDSFGVSVVPGSKKADSPLGMFKLSSCAEFALLLSGIDTDTQTIGTAGVGRPAVADHRL